LKMKNRTNNAEIRIITIWEKTFFNKRVLLQKKGILQELEISPVWSVLAGL